MKDKKNQITGKYGIIFVTIVVILSSIISFTSIAQESQPESITQTYTFEQPQINQITIQNTVFDQLSLSEGMSFSNPGEPDIPAIGVHLLLPPDSTIQHISIIPGEKSILGYGFDIIPSREPIILSEKNIATIPQKNTAIY